MVFKLNNPPTEQRERELWMEHAAGFIIFQDMRDYAIQRIPAGTDELTKQKIIQGIDDAVYGLTMMLDGVTGELSNEEYSVRFENKIQLTRKGEVIENLDTTDSDGMCMGFHMWKDNDFGQEQGVCPIADL